MRNTDHEGTAILADIIDAVGDGDPFPTMADLLELFRSKEFSQHARGTGRDSLFSIIDKLANLIIQLGPILACQRGVDVRRLYEEGRVLSYSIEGLAAEHQNYLIVMSLIQYSHLFRTHGPRGQLNTIFIFDESREFWAREIRTSSS